MQEDLMSSPDEGASTEIPIKFDWGAPMEAFNQDENDVIGDESFNARQVVEESSSGPLSQLMEDPEDHHHHHHHHHTDQPQKAAGANKPTSDQAGTGLTTDPWTTNTTPISEHTTKQSSAGPSRRKKKPNGLPKRPLTAYNIFFQKERAKLLGKHVGEDSDSSKASAVSFEDMREMVARKWRNLPEPDRKVYEDLADRDTARYREEMEEHQKRDKSAKPSEGQSFSPQHSPVSGFGFPLEGGQQPATPKFLYPTTYPAASTNFYPRPVEGNAYRPSTYVGSQGHHPYFHHTGSRGGGPSTLPIPPGTTVTLPDENGEPKNYTVHYALCKMPRKEAEQYMQSLSWMKSPLFSVDQKEKTDIEDRR